MCHSKNVMFPKEDLQMSTASPPIVRARFGVKQILFVSKSQTVRMGTKFCNEDVMCTENGWQKEQKKTIHSGTTLRRNVTPGLYKLLRNMLKNDNFLCCFVSISFHKLVGRPSLSFTPKIQFFDREYWIQNKFWHMSSLLCLTSASSNLTTF